MGAGPLPSSLKVTATSGTGAFWVRSHPWCGVDLSRQRSAARAVAAYRRGESLAAAAGGVPPQSG